MATQPRPWPVITLGWLLKLAAFIAFVFAFCVAQTWFTKGDWTEWVAAGLALFTLGELVP